MGGRYVLLDKRYSSDGLESTTSIYLFMDTFTAALSIPNVWYMANAAMNESIWIQVQWNREGIG